MVSNLESFSTPKPLMTNSQKDFIGLACFLKALIQSSLHEKRKECDALDHLQPRHLNHTEGTTAHDICSLLLHLLMGGAVGKKPFVAHPLLPCCYGPGLLLKL
eukprot:1958358-Amphidinium_carterae.1